MTAKSVSISRATPLHDENEIAADDRLAAAPAAAAARREALRKIGKFSAYAAPAVLLVASGKAAATLSPE